MWKEVRISRVGAAAFLLILGVGGMWHSASVQVPIIITLPTAGETNLFSDNFDSYPAGSFPSAGGWEVVWGGTGQNVVVSDPSVSKPNSFQLWGSPNWSSVIQRNFSTTAPVIGYEFSIRIEKVGTGGPGREESPGFFRREAATWGGYYARVFFDHDTQQIEGERIEGAEKVILGKWSPQVWYKVKVVLDRRTNLYAVWIDGRLAGQNIKTAGDTYQINALALFSGHPGVKVWYDDVRVFTVGQPDLPDLVVDSITPSPANPVIGQLITFQVTVRNQGTAAAGAFVVRLQGAGLSQDRAVSSLAAGSSTSLTFSLPLSTSGETFTATADVNNQVSESNEGNNTRQLALAPPPPHSVSTPNTPRVVGSTEGEVGKAMSFVAEGASCSQGHPLQYRFDWGDGTISSWGSSSQQYAWKAAGTYQVKAQARCAVNTAVVSAWSSPTTLIIRSPAVAEWHIDFQGDANHAGTGGQAGPLGPPEAFPGMTVWNVLTVAALRLPAPTPRTPNPSLRLADKAGNPTGVTFSIQGDAYGWAGYRGADWLLGDYLIIYNAFGVTNNPTNWSLTGLAPNTRYCLTFYHAVTPDTSGRGLAFPVQPQLAAGVVGRQGVHTASMCVKSDAAGSISGLAAAFGAEGNWAGLSIVAKPREDGDYGDAPEPGFPSRDSSNGPCHLDVTKEWIGPAGRSTTTKETDARCGTEIRPPGLVVRAEDEDDGDPIFWKVGNVTWFSVRVSYDPTRSSAEDPRYLNVLVDVDGNGKWDGGDEWAVRNLSIPFNALPGGVSAMLVVARVPDSIDPIKLAGRWIRVTLSTQRMPDGTGAWGVLERGETEDHIAKGGFPTPSAKAVEVVRNKPLTWFFNPGYGEQVQCRHGKWGTNLPLGFGSPFHWNLNLPRGTIWASLQLVRDPNHACGECNNLAAPPPPRFPGDSRVPGWFVPTWNVLTLRMGAGPNQNDPFITQLNGGWTTVATVVGLVAQWLPAQGLRNGLPAPGVYKLDGWFRFPGDPPEPPGHDAIRVEVCMVVDPDDEYICTYDWADPVMINYRGFGN